MDRENRLSGAICAAVAVVMLLTSGGDANAVELPIEWDDGGTSHNWTDADNWDPSTEGGPGNIGVLEFIVTVPGGFNPVTLDAPSPVLITDLLLGNNAKLVLNPGDVLLPPVDLEVLRTANIAGIIDAQRGNFTAKGSAALTGNRARIYASNGSKVCISAATYDSTGLFVGNTCGTFDWTLLSASGPLTELNLSTLASINAGFTDNPSSCVVNRQHITVTDEAILNLSGVTTLTGPGRGEDSLRFTVSGADSMLDMSSLVTITTQSSGFTIFDVADATISFPALSAVDRATFDVNGGEVHLPALEEVLDTRFHATDAARVMAITAPPVATYDSTGLFVGHTCGTFDWTLLSASGPLTELNLSTLASINAGFTDNPSACVVNRQHITVTDEAILNLSGVTTLTGPGRVEDSLRFTVSGADSMLDISSLGAVDRATFDVSGGEVHLPALEEVLNTRFHATDAARVMAITAPPVATYDSTGLFVGNTCGTFDWTLLSASGPLTELNLSTLASINAGFTDNPSSCVVNRQHITVTDEAILNLSGVTTLTGPGRGEDSLRFTVSGADSMLDMSSLVTITTQSSGFTIFDVADATISFPALSAVDRATFDVNGGEVHLPALEEVLDTRFHATDAARVMAITAPPVATYDSTGLFVGHTCGTFDWTLLSASGPLTELNLSTLASINAGFTDNPSSCVVNRQHITVTDEAILNLSGVTTLTAPSRGEDSLRFTVSGADSMLDMSELATITNVGSGRLFVNIGNGGHVQMGNVNNTSVTTAIDLNTDSLLSLRGLTSDSPLAITLNTATDRMEVSGSMNLGNQITIAAPAGGTLSVGGDFLHTHQETADLRLGLVDFKCKGDSQLLEVGGTDFDLQWQLLPDDNFGYQQLTIGQPGHATVVQLVDLYDNLQPGVPDSLLLWGIEDVGGADGVEGLKILGGSTFLIHDINVYALLDLDEDGVMERTRIRDLFTGDQKIIPFNHNGNNGFIAIEFIRPHDCNSNGEPDACDLDCAAPGRICNPSACGQSSDCNGNGIPDECDILNCAADTTCDDCNLNGVPDGCDLDSGTSVDVDPVDGVPDECIAFDGDANDHLWSTPLNWVTDDVPDVPAEAASINGDLVNLDIGVTIASLRILEGGTLNATGLVDENLTTEGGIRIAGSIDGLVESRLLVGNGRTIDVGGLGIGRLEITSGGRYEAAPGTTPSASLTAEEVLITSNSCDDYRGGFMDLSGTMSVTVSGDFILRGNSGCTGYSASSSDEGARVRGGFTPPIKQTRQHSILTIAGNLSLFGTAGWTNDSSEGVTLAGDFDNQGTAPSLFDWTAGRLLLGGTGGSSQTFEVAGLDLGATREGFATDQDAQMDTRPHTNFSIEDMEVAPGADARFANLAANTAAAGPCAEALYVETLSLGSGATVTIDNCRVYYTCLIDDGATIETTGCGKLVPLPAGGIAASAPPNGAIDARQPQTIDGVTQFGWDSVELSFGCPRAAEIVAIGPAAFETSEPAGGDGIPPSVTSVSMVDANTVTLTLSERVEPESWTRISHIESGTSICLGYLPGDVNNDGAISAPLDLTSLIDCINNPGRCAQYQQNTDREGTGAGVLDITRLIDLLNGAGSFQSWIGANIGGSCPAP